MWEELNDLTAPHDVMTTATTMRGSTTTTVIAMTIEIAKKTGTATGTIVMTLGASVLVKMTTKCVQKAHWSP